MRRFIVDDFYRDNPIVAAQIAQLWTSIQEEICSDIETGYGPLNESDSQQLLKSCLKTQLKHRVFFERSLYGGPNGKIENQLTFPFPDPFTSSYGFFDLSIYRLPQLLWRTEVFFHYDFVQATWIFRTKPDSPVGLIFDGTSNSLKVDYRLPIVPLTPWHLIQFKNLRLIYR